jgi:hypothetical protein
MDSISFLTNFFRLAPEVIILWFCIEYLRSRKTPDSILLTLGTGISLLNWIFNLLFFRYFYDSGFFGGNQFVMTLLGFAGFAGQVLFAIGLVLLIKKTLKSTSQKAGFVSDPEGPLDAGMN